MDVKRFEELVLRLESAVKTLENGGGSASGPAGDSDSAATNISYSDYCVWADTYITEVVKLSDEIG